jgi:kynurenine formamidase
MIAPNAGTHIDAPYHFGPTSDGQRARTIDDLPLDWFYSDGVVLDFSATKRPGESISLADVTNKLDRIGYRLKEQDVVLIRTGAADQFSNDPNFADLSIRLDLEAFLRLLDQGVRVIGCDAESLDGPVSPMLEALRSGKKESFFPIHYAGRAREFCLIHKMDLSSLPCTYGFKVVAFPVKLERCSASWTRGGSCAEVSERSLRRRSLRAKKRPSD